MVNQRALFHLGVVPGDGIGPEVIAEGLKVLKTVEQSLGTVSFSLRHFPVGAGEYLRSGEALSDTRFSELRKCDAILLGAIGLPDVRLPDGTEISPQLDLRERLDLYCGLRPLRLFHRDHTPLKGYDAGDIDFVLIRESTEGLFSSRRAERANDPDTASDTMCISRKGSERVFRAAFEQARRRRRLVTLVDKANVLPSMAFFRRIFDQVAEDYPDVRTEHLYVDAAALRLVRKPESFDVIVTENMFGDILSDLGAGLVGGMGMAPSADIGEGHAVFQPAHGSAPDIAGRGLANPTATILSVALMLEWLDHPETVEGARLIRRAVEEILAHCPGTRDLGGKLSACELGDLISRNVEGQR
ncbi:MAG: isocitrate/isopropylmalate dehydrogenase family protein [Acidobacteria bacterium]|nr:MAG: isocitrate/isopropylmalate dehydrogenase family protein [Acidobacteriota bacterium]